jgi:hypothetical protein
MAKKIEKTVKATLTKNTSVERGGAWLLTICQCDPNNEDVITHSAWSNPSAGKRYLKSFVVENTPRKSIKLEIKATDANGKPTHIAGELTYKVDA